jgi:hypothetical protein
MSRGARIGLVIALVLVTEAGAVAAGAGGRALGVSLSPIESFTWAQPAFAATTIDTSQLSVGGDTVVHVLTYPAGVHIASNDDYNGTPASHVVVPAVTTPRTIWIIVRAYSQATAGTGRIQVQDTSLNVNFAITYGGTFVTLPPLQATSHVFTVQESMAASRSILIVRDKDWGVVPITADEVDGVDTMSWTHLDQACTGHCEAIVGVPTSAWQAGGKASLVWDEDIHTATAMATGSATAWRQPSEP